jgi:membrane protein implicated in regulation of membrane protease activity
MISAILTVCAILIVVWLAIALIAREIQVLLIPLYVVALPFLWAVNYSTPYGRKRMREIKKRRRAEKAREARKAQARQKK